MGREDCSGCLGLHPSRWVQLRRKAIFHDWENNVSGNLHAGLPPNAQAAAGTAEFSAKPLNEQDWIWGVGEEVWKTMLIET